jgi:hypothetical protein
MYDFVPDFAIDRDEVFGRGGRNFGDEDFGLFKCPHCGRVYLIDAAVDMVYPDPKDVAARLATDGKSFACVGCGRSMPEGPWVGGRAAQELRVTWDDLRSSGWRWVATTEVMLRNKKRIERGEL